MLDEQAAVLQAADATNDHYCNNNHPYYEAGWLPGKYADSVCEMQDYNELHIKGEGEFFVQTSFIQNTVAVEDCTAAGNTACSVNFATVAADVPAPTTNAVKECSCMKDKTRFISTMTGTSPSSANERCTCISRRHVFTPGVEAMSINLQAGMTMDWSSGFGVCSGSTVVSKPRVSVRTTDSSEDLYTFPAGSTVTLPMKTLLNLAGIGNKGLDEVNAVSKLSTGDKSGKISKWGFSKADHDTICAESSKPSFCNTAWTATTDSTDAFNQNRWPTYRQTGLAIEMNVDFSHECGVDGSAHAIVTVKNRNIAWNSKGSSTQYRVAARPTFDSSTPKKRESMYDDTYKFGVKVVFTYTGSSTRMDFGVILTKIGEAFLFIMVSSTIMTIVTFYLVPQSKFYRTRRTEEVNFDHVNARLAAQTAMGIVTYKALAKDSNGNVGVNSLTECFKQTYPIETAKAMAKHVMELGDTDGGGTLEFNEFMRVIVEDVKSFDIMLHSLRPHYEAAVGGVSDSMKLPAPFDMWEKRTTAEGIPYFANHVTKTTAWVDPRSQIQTQMQMPVQQMQQMQQVVAGGQQYPVVPGGQVIPMHNQQHTA